jgi:chromosome segregation ATPase
MVKLENQAKQADTRLKSLQDSLDKAKETEIKLVEEMKGAANNPKALKKLMERVQSNALLRAKLEGDVATAQEEKRALDIQVKNAQINSVMLENQVNEHEKAREMMKKVFEKNADKIGVFQDFVAQIETTLLQYGITADGELLSDEVRTAMNGMSEDEMFDFKHNVGDKAFDVTVARRQEKKGGDK